MSFYKVFARDYLDSGHFGVRKRGRDRRICTMCHGVNLDQRATALKILLAQAKEGLERGCVHWWLGLCVEEHMWQVGILSLFFHFHKNVQKIFPFLCFFEQTLDFKPPESSCAGLTALLADGCQTGPMKAVRCESWSQPMPWYWIRTTSLLD